MKKANMSTIGSSKTIQTIFEKLISQNINKYFYNLLFITTLFLAFFLGN